ncbi:MAG: glycosyltransferase family 10 [Bacteroidota bacterium]|nr:glycosyltransferase family 10 [Bacteroidota bacterium]
MTKLKINFVDFWPDFDATSNFFLDLLKTRFDLEISDSPDFIIYSVFGTTFRNYHCTRIFYTGENIRPNFDECDFALSFDFIEHPRHFRLPLYVLYLKDPKQLVKEDTFNPEKILQEKSKFCNFIYSNGSAQERIDFFEKLSKYKKVDSGGRVRNNLGCFVLDKLDFIKDYKFTIAFENSSYPGYTTEKLVHPMLVHSLPIYWGNPRVDEDFNPKSFLNYFSFDSDEELIARIIGLDRNDELYCRYLREPYYYHNEPNKYVKPEYVLGFFEKIFEWGKFT